VSFAQSRYTSGGGFSVVADRPSYQDKAVTDYLNSGIVLPPSTYYNTKGRGFPDVSALGASVLIQYTRIEPVSGTSASAPIFAGILALLNDLVNTKTGKPLGFVNPLLYQMWEDDPTTFTDIITGDNNCTEGGCFPACKGFKCSKGWDPVTGLGTPVYTNMLAYVKKFFNITENVY